MIALHFVHTFLVVKFAIATGMQKSSLSRYFHLEREIPSGTVGRLCQELKVSPEEKLPWVESIDSRLGGAIGTALNSAGEFLVDSNNWPTLLGGVVQVGLSILNGAVGFLTVTILTLYFMAALPSIKRVGITLVAKSSREKLEGIVDKVIGSVGRYVMGQVVVSSINTSILFTVLMIAGVEFAVVLAFINFLLVLIPIIGSITGAAIVILITAATSPAETTIAVAVPLLPEASVAVKVTV